jgi:hypothetical protein
MNKKVITYSHFYFLSVLILLLGTLQGNAQSRNIYELENAKYETDRSNFYDLSFKLQPTVYFTNQKKKVLQPETPPVKLNLNGVKALSQLQTVDFNTQKIELISISLYQPQDLNTTLNLTTLSQFKNLKYIFIKCYFNTNALDIQRFIKINPNTAIRVFYKTEIPS